MKKLLLILVLPLLMGAGCSNTTNTLDNNFSNQKQEVADNIISTANYKIIKYRSDTVDVSDFEYVDTSKSSWVQGAWYNSDEEYMVINLSGTNYQHCGVTNLIWFLFTKAESFGSYYNNSIKNKFNCSSFIEPIVPIVPKTIEVLEPIVPIVPKLVVPTIPSYNYSGQEHCEDALSKCKRNCPYEVYDYDSGEYLYNTDAVDTCEDACKDGFEYCEDENNIDDGCWEFKRKCKRECTDEVYDYDSGEYLYMTDSIDLCEDACQDGYRWCD